MRSQLQKIIKIVHRYVKSISRQDDTIKNLIVGTIVYFKEIDNVSNFGPLLIILIAWFTKSQNPRMVVTVQTSSSGERID